MEVISVLNMKGGVAKTTLCVNLSVYLSTLKKRVLIIDTDPQFNATQAIVSPETYTNRIQKGWHTIYDIFDDNGRIIPSTTSGIQQHKPIAFDDIKPWPIRVKPGILDIIPGNLELYRLEMAPGSGRENRLKHYIDTLRDKDAYDFVFIDTPPTPSAWMTAALIASSHYLIPVKPEPLSVVGTDLLRSVINSKQTNYGLKINCIGIVLTMAEKRTNVFQETQAFFQQNDFWKDKIFESYLPKRTSLARLQGQQRTYLSIKEARVKHAVMGIGNELIERISS